MTNVCPSAHRRLASRRAVVRSASDVAPTDTALVAVAAATFVPEAEADGPDSSPGGALACWCALGTKLMMVRARPQRSKARCSSVGIPGHRPSETGLAPPAGAGKVGHHGMATASCPRAARSNRTDGGGRPQQPHRRVWAVELGGQREPEPAPTDRERPGLQPLERTPRSPAVPARPAQPRERNDSEVRGGASQSGQPPAGGRTERSGRRWSSGRSRPRRRY